FYLRELRIALDHYIVSLEREEDFEIAERGGLPRLHPFLDADLLSLLFRTPPELLCQGGRAKGLVRGMLAKRFPDLGFERQKKIGATNFMRSKLLAEGKRAFERLGGKLALAELGAVDAKRWRLTSQRILAQTASQQLHYVWTVLSMESWLRTRLSMGGGG
ncbi:MAG: asparagine synthase-related protein, partial [Candidatus Binatia bacterium]